MNLLSSRRFQLFAILAVALFLRVFLITWSLPNGYHTATYNCDESTALSKLQEMNPAKWQFNPVSERMPYALSEGTFHLYVFCASLKIASLAGALTLTPSKEFYFQHMDEWAKLYLAGRLLSVLFGVATVLLCYFLGRRFYSGRTGLLAALFVALMPSHVVNSRYIIMNVPGLFWITLTIFFLKEVVERGRPKDYLLAGAMTGLSLATRYSAAPLLPLLLIACLLGRRWKADLLKLAGSYGFAVLFFLIGEPYALLDYPNFIKGVRATGTVVANGTFHLAASVSQVVSSFGVALGWVLLALCLAGVAWAAYRRSRLDLLLLAWLLLLIVPFVRAGTMATAGRILPALPFLALLGARLLSDIWERFPALCKGLVGIILLWDLVFFSGYFRLISREDIRDEASRWIIANIKPGSSIGVLYEPGALFSPGIIDRNYRHPDDKSLPGYRFVILGPDGEDEAAAHEARPEYLVLCSNELPGTGADDLVRRLEAGNRYRVARRFDRSFGLPGIRLSPEVPQMFYILDRLYVLVRS